MDLEAEKKYWEQFSFDDLPLVTDEDAKKYFEKEQEYNDFKARLAAEEEKSPERVAQKKFSEQQRQEKNLRECGIGPRYKNIKASDYKTDGEPHKSYALTRVKQFICNPKGKTIWMCGNPGTGKTMLSALICRYLGGRYVKSYEIEDELDIARSFNAKDNVTQVIRRFAKYPCLVIDEIGKMKSQNESKFLFKILNERYERGLPTVLVSNLSKKELSELLGAPLVDRFAESCIGIEFDWESYRKNYREGVWENRITEEIFD